MSIIDRVIHSQEHSFIAMRANGLLGLTFIALAGLTFAVLPSIIA